MQKRKPYTKNWPRKNLGELIGFIEQQYPDGFSLEMLAERMNTSVQNVSRIFVRDDMKLSKAEEITNIFGYKLVLFFPERERIGLDYSPYRKKEYPNAKNLTGLVKYINDSNISINYMSQRINKANIVLMNAFNRGDIFISTLYDITHNLNIEFMWEFRKTI